MLEPAESGRGQEFPSFVPEVESALHDTAATVINRLRLARNMVEQPPEVTDQFAPRGGVQRKSLEDWRDFCRRGTEFACSRLSGRPIK